MPLDPASQVRSFLRGIKNTSFTTVKATVVQNAAINQDLSKCIMTFKDTMAVFDMVGSDKTENDQRNIGSMRHGRGNINRGG